MNIDVFNQTANKEKCLEILVHEDKNTSSKQRGHNDIRKEKKGCNKSMNESRKNSIDK